ncbi:MAG: CBS domain-containing protein [Candidatus Pacearchaeota archaeon]|nr:CBS domain-containing protein [Candidatus Pacearchaeota archaeon]
MKIKDIMNKAVAIDHDIKLKEAARIMADKNIGSLIVINKEKILGIITEKDIMDNISRLDSKISSVMTKNVVTIDQEESVDNAARTMRDNKIKRLPVVKNEKLAGIITATDVIANCDDLNENFFFE